jgi:hypothetical protein
MVATISLKLHVIVTVKPWSTVSLLSFSLGTQNLLSVCCHSHWGHKICCQSAIILTGDTKFVVTLLSFSLGTQNLLSLCCRSYWGHKICCQSAIILTGDTKFVVSLLSFSMGTQNLLSAPQCSYRKAMNIRQPHITVRKSLDKSVSLIIRGL